MEKHAHGQHLAMQLRSHAYTRLLTDTRVRFVLAPWKKHVHGQHLVMHAACVIYPQSGTRARTTRTRTRGIVRKALKHAFAAAMV